MKFIGQFIQNFIARFRSDVYLENISTGTIASGGNLGLDSNNKIVKANEASGDIEGVTAGDGLTGGGTTGTVALAVGAGTGIDVAADAVSVDVSDFMTNGSDNRVVTATGTDAMNGEANLTFDGSTLAITGDLSVSGDITSVGDDVTIGDNLILNSASGVLRFEGTHGGGNEGIIYLDSGGGARFGLLFPGSDVVALANRASNGTVEIRANTSTAGASGEQTVATFTDTELTLATGFTFDSVALTAVQTASESFADNDTSLMTSAAINDAIIKGGNVTTIKVLPYQFMQNEDGGANKSVQYDDTGTIGVRASSDDGELYAFVEIPIGKTATSVIVYGSDTGNVVEVFEADINANGLTDKTPGGGCVVGGACDITDVAADATNYLVIKVTVTSTSDIVYGAAVTVSG